MSRAGLEPPEQSHASYEANALPQSITAGLENRCQEKVLNVAMMSGGAVSFYKCR